MNTFLFIVFVTTIVSVKAERPAPNPHPRTDKTYCIICESVMSYVENWIAENKTMAEIKTLLESICIDIPKNYQNACDNFIDYSISEIIDYVENNYPPDTVCDIIGVCEDEEICYNGIYCTVCESIMSYIEKWLAEGKTITEIETLLNDLCDLFPDNYELTCSSIVDQYVPLIIKYIETDISPDEICALLGLCT